MKRSNLLCENKKQYKVTGDKNNNSDTVAERVKSVHRSGVINRSTHTRRS
jgi:hypothetical protein